ncbi:MAG: hypothetical protein HY720_01300 [Planctomycetes bacterium]|nr:hypothetical protein [Planctomycetota bacterium]
MSRASFRELFERFFGALEAARVEYFAYGGVAVALWADPRETQDVDVVVSIGDQDCSSILDTMRASNFDHSTTDASLFPIDGFIRLSHRGRHADLALGRTPFDRCAFERRGRATLLGREIWVASAEDLLLYKLVAYRFKDLADARAVVVRQGGKLDLEYLRRWSLEIAVRTRKFEVPQKLEELLAAAGL